MTASERVDDMMVVDVLEENNAVASAMMSNNSTNSELNMSSDDSLSFLDNCDAVMLAHLNAADELLGGMDRLCGERNNRYGNL